MYAAPDLRLPIPQVAWQSARESLASPWSAGGAADALVGTAVFGELGEMQDVAVLAQGTGGGCRLVAPQPRQPVADLPLRFPLVPGCIPGQHDANGFLQQREISYLARPVPHDRIACAAERLGRENHSGTWLRSAAEASVLRERLYELIS